MESLKLNKKSQTTPGFILGIGIVLFLFILISIFYINKKIELTNTQENLQKVGECLKFANIINSVYIGGHGTEVWIDTNYIVTIFNTSQISIEDLNITKIQGENIAFLASESAPTSEKFYNEINNMFEPNPDWYKTCFSNLGTEGCQWNNTEWIDQEIEKDFSELIDNLDNYTTIYLESPTIRYDSEYLEKIQNWAAKGNALIISEHLMCRSADEFQGESSCQTCYTCHDAGNNDDWNLQDTTLHQRGQAAGWNNTWNVKVITVDGSFQLDVGDKLSVEERNHIENKNANNFITIAKYGNHSDLIDSSNQPAIAYWNYGQGKIFYFPDFQTNFIGKEKNFTEVLANLITAAYNLIHHPELESDIFCPFSARTFYQRKTGTMLVKNQNNEIIFQNVN